MDNEFVALGIRLLSAFIGIYIIFTTLKSAVRTFVLPRGANTRITGWVFVVVGIFFRLGRFNSWTYEERDRRMALYAPTALLLLPIVWMIMVMVGYSFIYFALGVEPFEAAMELSGSSLLTLGTVPFQSFFITLVEFSEAAIGLGLMALLIAYLPTMYASFSQREAIVSMLEVRAGSPPSAETFITRLSRINGLEDQNEMWGTYELWFTQIEESHTSLAPLNFFRSPDPKRSWITTAGVILDTAALISSTVDVEREPRAELCIRAGYLTLRSIADFFNIEHTTDPNPDDPISISKEEFFEVYENLSLAGVALKPDRDECWQNFAGWRVNYDDVLLQLSTFLIAPYAPWSSDRSLPVRRKRVNRWRLIGFWSRFIP